MNVTIRDQNNVVVGVLGASQLHNIYLSIGYLINMGNYTSSPTVVVNAQWEMSKSIKQRFSSTEREYALNEASKLGHS